MRVIDRSRAASRFGIEQVSEAALPEIARFLSHDSEAARPGGVDERGIERYLEWLLLENPVATDDPRHGFSIRDQAGRVVGLLLSFPAVFLAGDRRIAGLGSGAYFVEPEARTLGFYLFKKHLKTPGYAFFFTTSCNANSAALWRALGAAAVPRSDREYVFHLNLDVVLPAFLASRTENPAVAKCARAVGRWTNPVLRRLAWPSTKLVVEPSRDWEKLAALARRHRPARSITTDRSPACLEWRYGRTAPNHPFDVCVFRDGQGHEGWFSLGHITRGRQGQIRGRVLLDAVWPRERMSFADVFPATVRLGAPTGDALYLHDRLGVDGGASNRWSLPWRLDAPRSFVIADGDAAALASSLDLVAADGDGAF